MKIKLEDVIISFDHKKQSHVPIKYEGDPKKIQEIKTNLTTKGASKYGFKVNPDEAYAADFMLAVETAYDVEYKHSYKLYSPPAASSYSAEDGVYMID